MTIASARKKLRDARKDLEEMKADKDDYEEFDRRLSHFLSDARNPLDHLTPDHEGHEANDWEEETQEEYKLWYRTLPKLWKSPLNEGNVLHWLQTANNTNKHEQLTGKLHQDVASGQQELPNLRQGEVPDYQQVNEDDEHRYYFSDPPKGCEGVEIEQIAEMVLFRLEEVFEQIEHQFPVEDID